MDFPAQLPESLAYVKDASDDKELVELAAKDLRTLTTFFEIAAADESWPMAHPQATREMLERLSFHFLEGNLSQELADRTAYAVRSHPVNLLSKVPRDLNIQLKDATVQVSSLLLGTLSPLFATLLSSADKAPDGKWIELPLIPVDVFKMIEDYMETGRSEDLWKMEYPVVLEVYKSAIEWEIGGLPEEAAGILKRYVTQANFIGLIKECMKNRWLAFYAEVLKIANTYDLGVQFTFSDIEFLEIEFNDYRESAIDIFEELRPWITHLGFFGPIVDDPRFTHIITSMRQLVGLRLNEVKAFTNRFLDIPSTLEELDISQNPWLTSDDLKILVEQCPNIKRLNLKNDTGIDYKGFGYLKKLSDLESLTLTKCYQVNEDDLLLICQGCPKLLHLDLEGCERLSGKSFETLSRLLQRLEVLSIARLPITDAELIDLAHRLKNLNQLNLERCDSFSDSGIIEAVQSSFSLKHLKLKHTPVSAGAKEKIASIRPALEID
ncbi:hypothetical protein [Estrella lausannensis]|uniref:hypothetical protein n=1 Tax=Estrella lausannensis TaxID=483423 RepID=UPI0011798CAF|nr:hypothetical protein [Estrella lausannensis]